MKRVWIKEMTPAILLSLAAGFMLFVFAPLEIYFSNKYEFWFDFYTLFPVCVLMFLVFWGVCVLLFAILHRVNQKLFYYGIIAGFIGFICTYVQGNYMVGNLPLLDGNPINWGDFGMQRVYSIMLWVITSVLVLFAVKKFSAEKVVKAAGAAGVAFLLIFLITVTTVGIMNDGLERKSKMSNTMNYALEMSTKQNFVIMVLDSVDGAKMSKAIEEHPEYREIFADFTYYSNTMAVYPSTLYAVPYLLSGEWYENGEDYMEYGKRAYGKSVIFDELEKEGYRLGLYEPEAFMLDESMFRFENVVDVNGSISSLWQFVKLELKLVGFKYMPFDLKRFCVTVPAEILALRTLDSATVGIPCIAGNQEFYEYVCENEITLTKDKCFRYFHLEGAHAPWINDEYMNRIENGTYEQSIEASMTMVAAYLEKLKARDVYDNTAIMILSDHGYNTYDENSVGRQHAIMYVKGIGESYDSLQISEAPISHVDCADAYRRLLEGKTGTDVFDYKEGDYRERRYLYYDFDDPTHFYETLQTGHASDENTLIFTGKEFIP